MATKGDLSSSFKDQSFTDTSWDKYSNINLNQNYKSLNVSSVNSNDSISKKNDKKFVESDNYEKKRNIPSWNSTLSKKYLIAIKSYSNYDDDETKQWKSDKMSSLNISNSSTLSLHIAAYENLYEKDTVQIAKNEGLKRNAKQLLSGSLSSSDIQNLFEFPRQQEENKKTQPETMEFKASQKLLNPNDQNNVNGEDKGESKGGYSFFETLKNIYDSKNTFFSYLPKMGIFDQFYEKAKSLFGESKEPYKKKDYYELLEVDVKATEDEIKRSYRKLALKYHPDKNIGKEEECAAFFTLLQQAHSVLMDPRERAFYDKHKDNILRDQDATEEKKDEGIKLYEYFQPCFKGYGDDPQGFYSVYRDVFDKLATEEFPYLDEDDEKMFPTFGRSDSDYDMVVAPFYDFWTNFSTSRTFAWLDKWNLRDGPNRATVRAMEKDNRKLRDAGKNERNDEIRSLAIYVRRRDKRVKAFREILEERKKKTQEEQENRRRQKIRENLEQLEDHVVDEEQMKEHLKSLEEIENQLDAEFGSIKKNNGDSEDEEEDEGQYCVVCEKGFKTSKSYGNHLKSRKHKQALEELKKHMKEEDALLLQDEGEESDEKEDTAPRRKGKSKKKRKKGKEEEGEVEDTVTEEIADKLNINVEEEDVENKEELNVDEEVTKDEKVKPKGKNKKKNKGAEPKKLEVKPDGRTVPIPSECIICGLDFESKTKLFKHIELTGHAVLKTENPNQKQAGKKKGKK